MDTFSGFSYQNYILFNHSRIEFLYLNYDETDLLLFISFSTKQLFFTIKQEHENVFLLMTQKVIEIIDKMKESNISKENDQPSATK
jgi:hypothetical protein